MMQEKVLSPTLEEMENEYSSSDKQADSSKKSKVACYVANS